MVNTYASLAIIGLLGVAIFAPLWYLIRRYCPNYYSQRFNRYPDVPWYKYAGLGGWFDTWKGLAYSAIFMLCHHLILKLLY